MQDKVTKASFFVTLSKATLPDMEVVLGGVTLTVPGEDLKIKVCRFVVICECLLVPFQKFLKDIKNCFFRELLAWTSDNLFGSWVRELFIFKFKSNFFLR